MRWVLRAILTPENASPDLSRASRGRGPPRQNGGVFWTKGTVTITGGDFYDNESPDRGGVFDAGADGVVTLAGGNFESNRGGDQGGVGFVTTGSTVYIVGGTFSANQADIDGGAFSVETSATFEVRIVGARRSVCTS